MLAKLLHVLLQAQSLLGRGPAHVWYACCTCLAALVLLHAKLCALPSQVHTTHTPLQGEQVADVLDSRSNRTVLLTNAHVVLLKASTKNKQTIYRTKWCLPISEVQNVRGKLHCPFVLAMCWSLGDHETPSSAITMVAACTMAKGGGRNIPGSATREQHP